MKKTVKACTERGCWRIPLPGREKCLVHSKPTKGPDQDEMARLRAEHEAERPFLQQAREELAAMDDFRRKHPGFGGP